MTTTELPRLVSVITPFPFHVESSDSIDNARQLMTEHRIRHLIVMKDGDISGLLSERELQHHAAIYGNSSDNNLTVEDICASNIVIADIHDPLDKVLDVMAEERLGCVVVLRDGELAGIFTTTDVCHYFALCLRSKWPNKDIPDIVA
jgi:acetoin utilization protein AcuB